jgi:hypothetical protein
MMSLGPGSPNLPVKPALKSITPENIFSHVQDHEMALACLAGLWLYHDFLDESHSISQELPSITGSCWHGIMHRREPDAWNSKYWFRKVGDHPVYTSLVEVASETGLPIRSDRWDPYTFVDLCEQHRDKNTEMETLLKIVQLREWELFFHWCFEQCTGATS